MTDNVESHTLALLREMREEMSEIAFGDAAEIDPSGVAGGQTLDSRRTSLNYKSGKPLFPPISRSSRRTWKTSRKQAASSRAGWSGSKSSLAM